MATSQEAQKAGAKLINNIQDISFGEIGLVIVLSTWLAIWLVRLVLALSRGPRTQPGEAISARRSADHSAIPA